MGGLEGVLGGADAGLRGAAGRWLLAGGALSMARLGPLLESETDERTRCEWLEEVPVDSQGLAIFEERLQAGTPAEALLITRLLAR